MSALPTSNSSLTHPAWQMGRYRKERVPYGSRCSKCWWIPNRYVPLCIGITDPSTGIIKSLRGYRTRYRDECWIRRAVVGTGSLLFHKAGCDSRIRVPQLHRTASPVKECQVYVEEVGTRKLPSGDGEGKSHDLEGLILGSQSFSNDIPSPPFPYSLPHMLPARLHGSAISVDRCLSMLL